MTINEIKSKWSKVEEYAGLKGKKMFTVRTFDEPIGKCVIMVINNQYMGRTVAAAIQVKTGEDILNGHSRPCDNMNDAIDVACELISDNWDDLIVS